MPTAAERVHYLTRLFDQGLIDRQIFNEYMNIVMGDNQSAHTPVGTPIGFHPFFNATIDEAVENDTTAITELYIGANGTIQERPDWHFKVSQALKEKPVLTKLEQEVYDLETMGYRNG